MRIRYWGRITRMEDERVVKQIYRASRSRMEREDLEIERGERDTHDNVVSIHT